MMEVMRRIRVFEARGENANTNKGYSFSAHA